MQCLYLRCDIELTIIAILLTATVLALIASGVKFGRWKRLRNCKRGKHEQYYYLSHGSHGYSTWCECKKDSRMLVKE